MANNLPFPTVWAVNGPVRDPTSPELDLGFPCGEADRSLFNGLFQDIEQAINAIQLRNGNADIPVNGLQAAPPSTPAIGDRYIVAASPTAAWAGQANQIAIWVGTAWVFVEPVAGLQVNYIAAGVFVVLWFDGADWKQVEKRLGRLLIYGAGSTSWLCPANVTTVRARGRGAGGGGGGSTGASLGAGGGSGGSYFDGNFTVVPGTTYPILVGAGGPGGSAAGTSGTSGGLTSFGTLATAPGGLGSLVSNSVPTVGAASPANAVGGQLNWKGCPGGNAFNGGGQGGPGGGSYGQGSINNPPVGGGNGILGLLPGVGGNGGGNIAAGGAGADGELILEY